jgi:hypothetical protein
MTGPPASRHRARLRGAWDTSVTSKSVPPALSPLHPSPPLPAGRSLASPRSGGEGSHRRITPAECSTRCCTPPDCAQSSCGRPATRGTTCTQGTHARVGRRCGVTLSHGKRWCYCCKVSDDDMVSEGGREAKMWDGVGWCGMVWDGVGWCGMVWDGVGWCGMSACATGLRDGVR